jgi:hypothetical protein
LNKDEILGNIRARKGAKGGELEGLIAFSKF